MQQVKKVVKENTEGLKFLNKLKGFVNDQNKELIRIINEEIKRLLS